MCDSICTVQPIPPVCPQPVRLCGWCSAPIGHLHSTAQYCCRQHKKNAASKRHRERNPGYYKRYHGSPARVAWLDLNKERVRAAAREYQDNLPDRADRGRRWRESHREYYQVRERNRRAAKLGNPGSVGVTERDWLRLCRRYRGCCAYCERKPDNGLHMDHVVPLCKGGRHAIGNILPACKSCNSSKGRRYLIDWRYRKAYELMGQLYGGKVA